MPGRTTLHIEPAFRALLASHGLADFDALLAAGAAQTLDKASLPPWRRRARVTLGDAAVFIKTYHHPPAAEQLRARVRGYKALAEIEWHWAKRLAALNIPAPGPVALGVRRQAGREVASLLVTAAVPGVSLQQWVADRGTVPRATRLALTRELAHLVGRLHGAGLFHRDLYLAHVFIDEQGGLTLLDLHRLRHAPWLPLRWRVKDLAALHHSTPAAAASGADRLRFFKLYRGRQRLTCGDRLLLRLVLTKARRIARHSRRHGLEPVR